MTEAAHTHHDADVSIGTGTSALGPVDQPAEGLQSLFARQRAASRGLAHPSLEQRRELLAALAGMVVGNRLRIEEAMADDFAIHARPLTALTEVLGVAGQAQYVIEQLASWMKPEVRATDPAVLGSGVATMRYQPKGVVGVLSPWNFPFLLSLGPLVDILAAGNVAILKPSEVAPACSELLMEMVTATFDPTQVAVVVGGPDMAERFAAMPWDHLLFTGSANVGRQVATAAAANLVPVTLELGGKNPALVLPGRVEDRHVEQVVGNKLVKAGQVCISPDYCLVHEADLPAFIGAAHALVERRAPQVAGSDDHAGIISDRHRDRLARMLEEARAAGAEVVTLGAETTQDLRTTRQMPLSLVINPGPGLAVMQEEIFGPILPVLTYTTTQEAIDYINDHDRPLGLYVFGEADEAEAVLNVTVSGGACINACAIQGVIPALGFGGVGPSGWGRHRGIEGFREFSNQRGVFVRAEADGIEAFLPPYAGTAAAVVSSVFGT